MDLKVCIIILNWNNWKDTIECLESLYQIHYLNYNVIIVDNDSEDDSLKKVREYCHGKIKITSNFLKYDSKNKPIELLELTRAESKIMKIIPEEFIDLPSNKKLVLIKNDNNYGFAEGNNIGMEFAFKNLDTDYILLLNNDTVVDKFFLNYMIENSEKSPEIGAAGPKIYYYNYQGKENVAYFEGGKISFLKGESKYIKNNNNERAVNQSIDYIEGSCFLIKKEVIENVGMLNKEYFLYWEEADWCTRIKKEGYRLINVPQAKIWHKSGDFASETHLYYKTRNQFLFMKKHSTKLQMFTFLCYFFLFKLGFLMFMIIFYYKKPVRVINFLKGVKDGLKIIL